MHHDLEAAVGTVIAVCVRPERGIPKLPQAEVTLEADCGIVGDRHAGSRNRQVSLIEQEVLDDLASAGMPVGPGILGENITVQGLSVARLCPGERLHAGGEVVLEVVEPRTPCRTLTPVDPRLPEAIQGRAGILCRVLRGGALRPGDRIERLS
jgi:MOSC domain-containing protein YiiM